MPEMEWEIVEVELGESGDPPKCPKGGPTSHRWVLESDGGFLLGLAPGEECYSFVDGEGKHYRWLCEDIVTVNGYEDIGLAPILMTMSFEAHCGNLGGWHGLSRCDCGWSWIIEPVHTHDYSASTGKCVYNGCVSKGSL